MIIIVRSNCQEEERISCEYTSCPKDDNGKLMSFSKISRSTRIVTFSILSLKPDWTSTTTTTTTTTSATTSFAEGEST